jgi:5-methylcytosine-specific restriction endonuclease McrA
MVKQLTELKQNTRKRGKPSQIISCLKCGKQFREYYSRLKEGKGRFCSVSCARTHMFKVKEREYIQRWLEGKEPGYTATVYPTWRIKRYLLEKYPACQECGWSKVNPYNNCLALQIDHIDGNILNNKPDNLRVLCPNCHALTPTWGPLNIGRNPKNPRWRRIKEWTTSQKK